MMQLKAVSFPNVTFDQVKRQFLRSHDELAKFNSHPSIAAAPDRIAQLKGFNNSIDTLIKLKLLGPTDYNNHEKQPFSYIPIDVMINLLFPDLRDVQGLQLASNYGPYLLYLKENGCNNMFGIDIDSYAIQYAQEIGVTVLQANAEKLPLTSSLLDLVISENFLDIFYLSPEQQNEILKEVLRVLKPNGFFISQSEDLTAKPEKPFSAEVQRSIGVFDEIRVFQKTA